MFRILSAIFTIVTMLTGFVVWAGELSPKTGEAPSSAKPLTSPSSPSTNPSPSPSPSTKSTPNEEPSLLEESLGAETILTTTPEEGIKEEGPSIPAKPTSKAPTPTKNLKQASKEASKETSKEASKEISKEASKEASTESLAVAGEDSVNVADLEVIDFVLANKVEGREPQEVVDTFGNNTDRGFAFARLNVKTPGKVTFVWYRNDHEYTRFTTTVQAAQKWRTYSSVKLRPGNWTVKLLAEDNSVLAEKTFILK